MGRRSLAVEPPTLGTSASSHSALHGSKPYLEKAHSSYSPQLPSSPRDKSSRDAKDAYPLSPCATTSPQCQRSAIRDTYPSSPCEQRYTGYRDPTSAEPLSRSPTHLPGCASQAMDAYPSSPCGGLSPMNAYRNFGGHSGSCDPSLSADSQPHMAHPSVSSSSPMRSNTFQPGFGGNCSLPCNSSWQPPPQHSSNSHLLHAPSSWQASHYSHYNGFPPAQCPSWRAPTHQAPPSPCNSHHSEPPSPYGGRGAKPENFSCRESEHMERTGSRPSFQPGPSFSSHYSMAHIRGTKGAVAYPESFSYSEPTWLNAPFGNQHQLSSHN